MTVMAADLPDTAVAINFDGRNGAACEQWMRVHGDQPDGERWFVTKGMSAATGGQAWRYVKGADAWPDTVRAAVYSVAHDEWLPVPVGSALNRLRDGRCYVVFPEGQAPVLNAGRGDVIARRAVRLGPAV